MLALIPRSPRQFVAAFVEGLRVIAAAIRPTPGRTSMAGVGGGRPHGECFKHAHV